MSNDLSVSESRGFSSQSGGLDEVSSFKSEVDLTIRTIQAKMDSLTKDLSENERQKMNASIVKSLGLTYPSVGLVISILQVYTNKKLSDEQISVILDASKSVKQLQNLVTVVSAENVSQLQIDVKNIFKKVMDEFLRLNHHQEGSAKTVSSLEGGGSGGAAAPVKAAAPIVSADAGIIKRIEVVEKNAKDKLEKFLSAKNEKLRRDISRIMNTHVKSTLEKNNNELNSDLDQLRVDNEGSLSSLEIHYLCSLQSIFNYVNFLRDASSFQKQMHISLLEVMNGLGHAREFLAEKESKK